MVKESLIGKFKLVVVDLGIDLYFEFDFVFKMVVNGKVIVVE